MNRDEFYTAFKHDIITSKLKPGELLKEKQIMQDYGIGRLPMREIMVRLQQENLIETIPRMGTVVTRLDIKHMRDVVELRLELECVVAKLAAERITDEQLGKLRELVKKSIPAPTARAMRRPRGMRNSISSCMKPRAMRSSPVSSTICFRR